MKGRVSASLEDISEAPSFVDRFLENEISPLPTSSDKSESSGDSNLNPKASSEPVLSKSFANKSAGSTPRQTKRTANAPDSNNKNISTSSSCKATIKRTRLEVSTSQSTSSSLSKFTPNADKTETPNFNAGVAPTSLKKYVGNSSRVNTSSRPVSSTLAPSTPNSNMVSSIKSSSKTPLTANHSTSTLDRKEILDHSRIEREQARKKIEASKGSNSSSTRSNPSVSTSLSNLSLKSTSTSQNSKNLTSTNSSSTGNNSAISSTNGTLKRTRVQTDSSSERFGASSVADGESSLVGNNCNNRVENTVSTPIQSRKRVDAKSTPQSLKTVSNPSFASSVPSDATTESKARMSRAITTPKAIAKGSSSLETTPRSKLTTPSTKDRSTGSVVTPTTNIPSAPIKPSPSTSSSRLTSSTKSASVSTSNTPSSHITPTISRSIASTSSRNSVDNSTTKSSSLKGHSTVVHSQQSLNTISTPVGTSKAKPALLVSTSKNLVVNESIAKRMNPSSTKSIKDSKTPLISDEPQRMLTPSSARTASVSKKPAGTPNALNRTTTPSHGSKSNSSSSSSGSSSSVPSNNKSQYIKPTLPFNSSSSTESSSEKLVRSSTSSLTIDVVPPVPVIENVFQQIIAKNPRNQTFSYDDQSQESMSMSNQTDHESSIMSEENQNHHDESSSNSDRLSPKRVASNPFGLIIS